jgi:hypothetical protein
MELSRELVQHIAVFGESGSGKTVLVSSFYGATQEPQFSQKSLFRVVADDFSQHSRLHQNYLGMKKSAKLPDANRLAATSYSFSIKLKDGSPKAEKTRPFDALRLVWHDYPGEWFEQDVSGPEEAQRRIDTFRSLLVSDVAVLLVDGQRLLDNSGEEERYLKSLLGNVSHALLSLKGDLLDEGKPLIKFPRIWVVALSKADLLPDMDVFEFRDLLNEKVADEICDLREVLTELVVDSAALSVGEDFLLLSSAKFDAGRIEVTKRVGLDLIMPVAAILPLERHVRWANAKKIRGKALEALLGAAGPLAVALIGKASKLPGPIGVVAKIFGAALPQEVLNEAARQGGDLLRERNSEALAKQDVLTATLTRFKMDLDQGEEEKVLHRSPR